MFTDSGRLTSNREKRKNVLSFLLLSHARLVHFYSDVCIEIDQAKHRIELSIFEINLSKARSTIFDIWESILQLFLLLFYLERRQRSSSSLSVIADEKKILLSFS